MNSSNIWYLGSMNDGLFIINTPPSPSGTDVPPGDYGRGPSLVLNVTDLPHAKAKAIVDAHNAALTAAPASAAEPVAWHFEWKPSTNNNPWQADVSLKDPRINPVRDIRNVRPLYAGPEVTP